MLLSCNPASKHFGIHTSGLMVQGLADHWKATQEWVTADGSVDVDAISERFGQAQVWVSDTTR